MGALNHIPALAIPAEQTDPVQQYSKLASIQALSAQRQQQQALMPGALQKQQQDLEKGLLENQAAQRTAKQTEAMNSAFQGALTVDPNTNQPTFDRGKVLNSVASSGNGSLIPQLTEKFNQIDKNAAELADAKDKHAIATQDYFGALASEVKEAGYSPGALGIALAHATANGYGQQAQQIQAQYAQNPDAIKQWVNQAIAGSPKQQEALKNKSQAALADTENQVKQQDLNFGSKVPQLNDALTQRYQVLHPGQALPAPFTLGPNASKSDFDRIDKILEATEKSQGTKAQQDTANAMREQTLALSQGKANIQPVIGTDPNSGKQVMVSKDDADKMGLTDVMKAGEQEATKAQAARHWISLADKKGTSPDNSGILQLIDSLDKQGKLGVVASRYNDFMAGKVGAGDPEITALRTKMGLSTTLLMNAHVGSRGGSYMLEHFQDLADAGKMNADTLRTGVKSELDYIKDRAMLPESGKQAPPQTTPPVAPTATGPNGHKITVKDGKWVDAQTGVPIQ